MTTSATDPAPSATATLTLNNGVAIPRIGFGVFQIPLEATQRAVEEALAVGYRHIDTAAAYNNEAGVGAALRASGLPRKDVFITTKLRNGDQGKDTALRAYDDSCARLGLDFIDLYLIHWPYPSADRYVESWAAMGRICREQRVRSIGVSNFLIEHLDRLAEETDIVPAVNQIELHPTYQQPKLSNSCRERGIVVEAYSPLGQAADLALPVVREIAERHDTSAAQVVLRWHVQSSRVAIPKSATPDRIRSNHDLDSFQLTEEDMTAMAAQDRDNRIGGDPQTFSLSQIR
ncbi:MAG: aldo/keto reductase [Propionibacteriaceae bacterium]